MVELKLECIGCQRQIHNAKLLTTIQEYSYYECPNCHSIVCDPLPPSNDIAYGIDKSQAQWLHYVDCGAGIDFMCRQLPTTLEKSNLVDVGCGFGYTLDYWNFLQNRNSSIGFDSSYMTIKGKELLKFDLQPPNFNLNKYLENKSIDFVFASEVIEHVTSPYDFLNNLISLFKNSTKLIIFTTPSAEFVLEDPHNLAPTRIAAYSPGFHTCLLSAYSIKNMLINLGIKEECFKIERENERLIIKIGKIEEDLLKYYENNYHDLYLKYLEKLSSHNNLRISDGAAFRLFKENVNLGNFDLSNIYRIKLEKSLQDNYKINIFDFEEFVILFELSASKSFEEHTSQIPAWLGSYLFYSAQYYRGKGFPFMQREILNISNRILQKYIERFPTFALEASDLFNASRNQIDENSNFINARLNIFSETKFTSEKIEQKIKLVK